MEITCYRDTELLREPRQLPAQVYNLAHTILAHSETGSVFVPIRSMQYLCIIDAEEWVFIDAERKNLIGIAWQKFHPQARQSLDDPVPYEAVYYQADAADVMRRLLVEFPRALQQLGAKEKPDPPAKVLKLKIPRSQ